MTSSTATPIRLISFVVDGVFSPVLDSQVVVPLGLLGTHAPDIRRALLVLTSIRHRRNPKRAAREEAIRAALPGVHVAFAYRPNLGMPLEYRLWNRALRRTMAQAGYDGTAPIVVHCRGEGTAAAAVLCKRRDPRLRVLVDMRGAAEDEARKMGVLAGVYRWRVRRSLRLALGNADGLNAVSTKLIDHLREAGLLTRTMPQCIVGCCADTTRFYFDATVRAQQREELGFGDKFVVCYCGSMVHYQRPDIAAQALAGLLHGMPDAHIFIVSHESDVLAKYLTDLGVGPERITARAARHDQVAPYLMAADVGLLLRENNLTNRVASPVKFAEYVRCGLPVILTPHIGDLSDTAVQEGVGATVEFPPLAEDMQRVAGVLRARLAAEGDRYRTYCSRLAGERFAWDTQIDELIRVYGELVAGPK